MFNRITISFAVVLIVIAMQAVFSSCRPEELEQRDNFDRNSMLKSISDNQITPELTAFDDQTYILDQAISNLVSNPTLANLTTAQEEWITTALLWEDCASLNFGLIMDAFVFDKIEYRPLNAAIIETYIQGTQTLNSAFIETIGSSSKGLPAIEYLLFSPDGNNQTVIDSLTTNPRRGEYLDALSINLEEKSGDLKTTWNTYYPTFIQYEGNNVGGSVSELMNEMSSVLEAVYVQRLGFPLGKNDFTNTGQPGDVEAPLSQQSLEFIKHDVKTVEELFFNDGPDNLGFDDYLNALGAKYNGEPLPTVIRAQFDKVNAALDAIPGTLANAVVNNYDLVEKAYLELKELVILMKVDVASQLSITITFNDNDGD